MPRQFHSRAAAPRAPFAARRVLAGTALGLALAAQIAAQPALAQETGGDWIDTWSASPQPVWGADFFAPVGIPRALFDQTIRQVARVSLGGSQLRVEISNEYGDAPLTIGAAHVALAGEGGAVVAGSDHALTFGGKAAVTVPPGAPVWSDPVDLAVKDLGSVAISLYFPGITPTTTWHNDGVQTAHVSGPGDFTGAERFDAATTTPSRIFVSGIAVDADPAARAVVLFGDSITDGNASTPDANNRWPDVLAERLVAGGAEVAVLNEGISGARILRDRMGDNALARFDRDVLSHPRVDTVVLMMGINDVGWPGTLLTPEAEPAPSAEDVIAGYEQLIARAHAHGLTIIGATLTPFENTFQGGPLAAYYDTDKEAKRVAINDWIRNGGGFDGVIDFDAVVQDPANPKAILADYDSGDHLHPNDAGYEAMGQAVDLGLLGVPQ